MSPAVLQSDVLLTLSREHSDGADPALSSSDPDLPCWFGGKLPLAARALRMPRDIRAGARDWRLWHVQLQFERTRDAWDTSRRYFLHRHRYFGRRDDLDRRECDRPIALAGAGKALRVKNW
jgi:hypothetical protein